MNESNEVPTYQPPEGVHGPTLGIALPDGCERLRATWDPHTASADRWLASGAAVDEYLYWWRFPPASQEARSILAPTPPWPGAVLSGLVDEDGVPTWLAQAGQVRGEQVRACTSVPWLPNTSYGEDEWVEVRAPRAVPVPETERVPWWEAKDRLGLAGDRFVEVGADDEGPWVRVVEGGTKLHSPVEPDGTVKVLKDGDQ